MKNQSVPSSLKLKLYRLIPITLSVIILNALLVIPLQINAQSWSTGGNNITGTEVIGTLNAKPLRFVTKGKQRLKLTLGGRVSIGGHNPEEKLDVAGAIKIANTSLTATGTIRWTGNDFEGYDGSVWRSFTTVTETDPKVGSNTSDFVSKWNGSSLVTSNIYSSGAFVGINTSTPVTGYNLAVDGKIICEELKVQTSGAWPDYVFSEDYDLMSLSDLADFIKINKHLPGIPDAEYIQSSGISVGEISTMMMEKIEELTLHMIEQSKRIEELEKMNSELQKRVSKL